MSIDPETVGTGAGGSLIGAFFAWLGFREKIKSIGDDVKSIEIKLETLVTKSAMDERCNLIHKNLDDKVEGLKDGQKEMNNTLKYLAAKIDTLRWTKKGIEGGDDK